MTLAHWKTLPTDRIHALTGLTPAALAELLAVVLPVLTQRRRDALQQRPHRPRALGAGAKRRLSPAQEVVLVLIYLRHNVAHEVVGQLFGVSADTSENLFHEIVPLLRDLCPATRFKAEKRWQRGEPSWTPDEVDRVLIDTFETSIPRPTGAVRQKRVYSGKKKRHTLKTQVATDSHGELLTLDAGHPGPTADKRIYERSAIPEQFPRTTKQGDLAYVGTAGVETPQRKPRGGALTPAQRAENRQKASVRVHVEHGIRRLKAFHILRENYRHALGLFPMVAAAIAGLVHLGRLTAMS
jgi:DDE superfamily endonuclease/Helix-turn-helix of DDE superfamily endonuclease